MGELINEKASWSSFLISISLLVMHRSLLGTQLYCFTILKRQQKERTPTWRSVRQIFLSFLGCPSPNKIHAVSVWLSSRCWLCCIGHAQPGMGWLWFSQLARRTTSNLAVCGNKKAKTAYRNSLFLCHFQKLIPHVEPGGPPSTVANCQGMCQEQYLVSAYFGGSSKTFVRVRHTTFSCSAGYGPWK